MKKPLATAVVQLLNARRGDNSQVSLTAEDTKIRSATGKVEKNFRMTLEYLSQYSENGVFLIDFCWIIQPHTIDTCVALKI